MRRYHAFVVLLLASTAAGDAQAFNFSLPFFPGSSDREGPPMGPPPWRYRPQGPSNAQGAPPGYGPSAPPGGQTQGYQPGAASGPGYQSAPGYGPPPGYQSGPQYPSGPGYSSGQAYPSGPGYQPGAGYQGYPPSSGYRPYWPGQPGQYGGAYSQQTQQTTEPPRLHVEVQDREPYVLEHLLVKLQVISDQNLATADPDIPNSSDFLLESLVGPTARSRMNEEGRQEIVNEFVYTLTPLHPGDMEIPVLKVTGTTAGSGYYGGSSRFEASSDGPIQLQVRPPMASVQPWLPLESLAIKATLDREGDLEAGQPVSLTLELSATGATGSQLPSLESKLRSKAFRVYREQTLTDGKLSADGRRLIGKRTEYYTLVPVAAGKLGLPEIRLPWWNIKTGTREYATLPIRTLHVQGESALSAAATTLTGGGAVSWFWLPVSGLVLLLLGYWGGVWYRSYRERHPARGPMAARVGQGVRAAASEAAAGLGRAVSRLNPAPALRRIRSGMGRTLPASTRLLMCVRAANREREPVAWVRRFQETTYQQLRFDAKTPVQGVTGRILALRPSADPEQVRRLMEQLDAALYGRQDIDFERWKHQFQRQVGRTRGLMRGAWRRTYWRRPLLPELNPQPGR
jgi:hypothetical protein